MASPSRFLATRVAIALDAPDALVSEFRARGYFVSAYSTRKDAEALFGDPHDAIIVSSDLPGGSGLDLVAQLRSRHTAQELPILVLSSHSEDDYLRAYAAGASDCLAADVAPEMLLAKCARHLENAKRWKKEHSAPGEVRSLGDGLLFQRYRVTGFLGEGSYGVVYGATDTKTGRDVALKILSDHEPESRRRFLRETYTLAASRGPHLVGIVDSGSKDDCLYYAMERVPGPSLQQMIDQSGAITEEQALALLAGLTEALALLGQAGLVHRDIKPANIILRNGSFADPVLVDFGLAKRPLDHGLTSQGVMLGTPGYMAPEIMDTDCIDERSDIFAAGVVLIFACSGQEAFPHLKPFALLQRMCKRPVPIPRGLTLEFRTLLRDMTRIDREYRIPSATEVRRRLSSLRSPDPREGGVDAPVLLEQATRAMSCEELREPPAGPPRA